MQLEMPRVQCLTFLGHCMWLTHSGLGLTLCRRAAGVLLTAAAGPTPRATFAFLIGAQALFGFGCGGEFPVAASSAAERAESEAHLKGLRGRTTAAHVLHAGARSLTDWAFLQHELRSTCAYTAVSCTPRVSCISCRAHTK